MVSRIILVQAALVYVNDFDFRAVTTNDPWSEPAVSIITMIPTVVAEEGVGAYVRNL
jgi:hypothetical protein